jgi:hypothetical protein
MDSDRSPNRTLRAKFQTARQELASALIERDDEIDLVLTALLCAARTGSARHFGVRGRCPTSACRAASSVSRLPSQRAGREGADHRRSRSERKHGRRTGAHCQGARPGNGLDRQTATPLGGPRRLQRRFGRTPAGVPARTLVRDGAARLAGGVHRLYKRAVSEETCDTKCVDVSELPAATPAAVLIVTVPAPAPAASPAPSAMPRPIDRTADVVRLIRRDRRALAERAGRFFSPPWSR